ncbi:unnamed protein product, partial [Closterium sp. Naga37s-1]
MCASNEDCGADATCTGTSVHAECVCTIEGTQFNRQTKTCEDSKTCMEIKCEKDCGADADCVEDEDGTLGCMCFNEEFAFNEADKTCFGPKLQTAVGLLWQKPKSMEEVTFPISAPAEQLTGTSTCVNVGTSTGGNAKITVVWDASLEAAGLGMCKSLALYSHVDCSGQPGLTIARPANKGRSYPVTKRCDACQ